MHAQVPQYLDVEDKIIGPLTLKQFIYLLLAGGLLFLLFNILRFEVFIILAIPIAILSILLAFYKIGGNQKFSQFMVSILGFLGKPNIYTWKKAQPERPAEEQEEIPPKIIKKTEDIKKISPKTEPEGAGLQELQWKIEVEGVKKEE